MIWKRGWAVGGARPNPTHTFFVANAFFRTYLYFDFYSRVSLPIFWLEQNRTESSSSCIVETIYIFSALRFFCVKATYMSQFRGFFFSMITCISIIGTLCLHRVVMHLNNWYISVKLLGYSLSLNDKFFIKIKTILVALLKIENDANIPVSN